MDLEETGCENANCIGYNADSLVHRNNCCTQSCVVALLVFSF